MATNAEWQARREAAVPRGVGSACGSVIADRAKNAEIWDVEGRRYIDFVGGIGVLNVGHCHPKVVEAAKAQIDRMMHPSFQVTPYTPYIELAERLNALAPGDVEMQTIFLTSGAEAVENAVKIARNHTGRSSVIAFTGGYHGRTLLTMALTGKVVPYKWHLGPMPGGIYHVPYPMTYRGISTADSLNALEFAFKGDAAPDEVAAIIIEPVAGEGGFYAAPTDFLVALREICDKHGIVLISDEVQAGFGRTGNMFGIEESGVVPDLLTVAKSLADGMPLSGVIGKKSIMDSVPPGGLGGTYGGNPVACAAGLAVLDVIEEENLLARSREIGERMTKRLRAMAEHEDFACIGDVRNRGGMIAFELVKDRSTREPAPEILNALRQAALERGLLLMGCGLYANVVRILVPLTASNEILDEGLDIIESSLRAIGQPV